MNERGPYEVRCCCLGMIGNTVFRCLFRGFDLGHCEPEEACEGFDGCRERALSSLNRQDRRQALRNARSGGPS